VSYFGQSSGLVGWFAGAEMTACNLMKDIPMTLNVSADCKMIARG
jgi:hypothetical protein